MKKLFIIGVDGATFRIVKPWIKQGLLPGFARLIEEGSHSILESSTPPLSPVAWTSMATGVNPGKHSIYDFLIQKKTGNGPPLFTFATGGDRTTKAFWQILSEQGKKCVVMNMPNSYPPDEINGMMISGWDGARDHRKSFFPDSLYDEVIEKFGAYYMVPIDLLSKREMASKDDESNKKLCEALLEMVKLRKKVFAHYAKETDWDVFFGVFTETDTAQHRFWPPPIEEDPSESPVFKVYKEIDKYITQMTDELGDTTDFMVVSDHGFDSLLSGIDLNTYLQQEGLLKRKASLIRSLVFSTLLRLGALRKMLKSLTNKEWMPKRLSTMKPRHLLIDFRRSKVFFEGAYSYFYATPGTDAEKLYPLLREKLLALEYRGNKVFHEVKKTRDMFNGPYVKNMPDFIGIIDKAFEVSGAEVFMSKALKNKEIFCDHLWNGNHQPDGVFIYRQAKGANPNQPMENLNVMDVAPTALALCDVAIPEEMDGKAIKQLLNGKDINFSQENIYKDPSIVPPPKDKDHMDAVKDRLEALGYM